MTLPVAARRIFLEGLEMACSIGVLPHEQNVLQRVMFDVEVRLRPETEPTEDRLSATLDYEAIHAGVQRIARSRHWHLQETLARALYEHLCSLAGVVAVRVRMKKLDAYPNCAVGYELASDGIEG